MIVYTFLGKVRKNRLDIMTRSDEPSDLASRAPYVPTLHLCRALPSSGDVTKVVFFQLTTSEKDFLRRTFRIF